MFRERLAQWALPMSSERDPTGMFKPTFVSRNLWPKDFGSTLEVGKPGRPLTNL